MKRENYDQYHRNTEDYNRLHKILHANRMSNLEEIDKFVEIYKIWTGPFQQWT